MTLTEQSAPASSSPELAALGAGLSDEDAPLVGRPTDDHPAAVGAVLEGVGLVAIGFDVFEGVGDEFF